MTSDTSDSEIRTIVVRLTARQHAAYAERAATIDRPMAWWIRAVLDRAIADHVGDPRQALLPFDGGPDVAAARKTGPKAKAKSRSRKAGRK